MKNFEESVYATHSRIATLRGIGPMPTTLAYPFAREAPSEYYPCKSLD